MRLTRSCRVSANQPSNESSRSQTSRPKTECARPQVARSQVFAKAKLAPENLHPEAMSASCCVCNNDDATDENDLALCDRCDKGYHQLCHTPPVKAFGNPDDQWFCAECTEELATERSLRLRVPDLAWVRFPMDSPHWPARVLRIDFSSLADPKPYWVQFFDTGSVTGAWVSDEQVVPWSEGPALSDVRDARRRLAVRLAEAAKNAPFEEPCEPTRPRKQPKIREHRSRPVSSSVAPVAKQQRRTTREEEEEGEDDTEEDHAPARARKLPKTRESRSGAVSAGLALGRRRRGNALDAEDEMMEQMEEMRNLIAKAKADQESLERELESSQASAV